MEEQTNDQNLAFSALALTREDRKRARRTFSRIAFSLAAYTAVSYAVMLLLRFLLQLSGLAEAVAGNIPLSLVLSVVPMYLCGLPVLWLIVRKMPKTPICREPFSPVGFLILFLVSRAFLTVGSLVSRILVGILERLLGHEIADSTTEMVESAPAWLLFVLVVLLAPLFEELIFRRLFIDRLAGYGDKAAILFSSALFGIAHGNFYQFVYTFLLGLLLGYLYTRTGKLRWSFLLHAITNFLGSVAALPILRAMRRLEELMRQESPDLSETFRLSSLVLSYSVILYGMALLGVVFFFLYKKRIRLTESEYPLPAKTLWSAAVCNPGTAVFLLVSLAEFILSVLPTS